MAEDTIEENVGEAVSLEGEKPLPLVKASTEPVVANEKKK